MNNEYVDDVIICANCPEYTGNEKNENCGNCQHYKELHKFSCLECDNCDNDSTGFYCMIFNNSISSNKTYCKDFVPKY